EAFRRASQLAGGDPQWEMWTGIALLEDRRVVEAARTLAPIASDEGNARELRVEAAFGLALAWCYNRSLGEATAAGSLLQGLIRPEDEALPRGYLADAGSLVHLIAGRLEDAIAAAKEAIAAYENSSRSDIVAYLWNLQGLAMLQMEQFERALEHLTSAASVAA